MCIISTDPKISLHAQYADQRPSRAGKWWMCSCVDKKTNTILWITLLNHQGWMWYNIKVFLSNMQFCYFSCQVTGPKWVLCPLVHCGFLIHLCVSGVHVNMILCYFFFCLFSIQTIWVTVILMIGRRYYKCVWSVYHNVTKVRRFKDFTHGASTLTTRSFWAEEKAIYTDVRGVSFKKQETEWATHFASQDLSFFSNVAKSNSVKYNYFQNAISVWYSWRMWKTSLQLCRMLRSTAQDIMATNEELFATNNINLFLRFR